MARDPLGRGLSCAEGADMNIQPGSIVVISAFDDVPEHLFRVAYPFLDEFCSILRERHGAKRLVAMLRAHDASSCRLGARTTIECLLPGLVDT